MYKMSIQFQLVHRSPPTPTPTWPHVSGPSAELEQKWILAGSVPSTFIVCKQQSVCLSWHCYNSQVTLNFSIRARVYHCCGFGLCPHQTSSRGEAEQVVKFLRGDDTLLWFLRLLQNATWIFTSLTKFHLALIARAFWSNLPKDLYIYF